MEEKVLSAEELLRYRRSTDQILPDSGGYKIFGPSGSWLQEKQVACLLQDRKDLLDEPRVCKQSDLALGEWDPDTMIVVVEKPRGKTLQSMGTPLKGKKLLQPEEALFLMETCVLEVFFHGVRLSFLEAYALFLPDPSDLRRYQVYSHLSRFGYTVVRHQGSLNITAYEKMIGLDKYYEKEKYKKSPVQRSKNNTENEPIIKEPKLMEVVSSPIESIKEKANIVVKPEIPGIGMFTWIPSPIKSPLPANENEPVQVQTPEPVFSESQGTAQIYKSEPPKTPEKDISNIDNRKIISTNHISSFLSTFETPALLPEVELNDDVSEIMDCEILSDTHTSPEETSRETSTCAENMFVHSSSSLFNWELKPEIPSVSNTPSRQADIHPINTESESNTHLDVFEGISFPNFAGVDFVLLTKISEDLLPENVKPSKEIYKIRKDIFTQSENTRPFPRKQWEQSNFKFHQRGTRGRFSNANWRRGNSQSAQHPEKSFFNNHHESLKSFQNPYKNNVANLHHQQISYQNSGRPEENRSSFSPRLHDSSRPEVIHLNLSETRQNLGNPKENRSNFSERQHLPGRPEENRSSFSQSSENPPFHKAYNKEEAGSHFGQSHHDSPSNRFSQPGKEKNFNPRARTTDWGSSRSQNKQTLNTYNPRNHQQDQRREVNYEDNTNYNTTCGSPRTLNILTTEPASTFGEQKKHENFVQNRRTTRCTRWEPSRNADRGSSRNMDWNPSRKEDREQTRNADWKPSRNSDRVPSSNTVWEPSGNSDLKPSRNPELESSRNADLKLSKKSDRVPSGYPDSEPSRNTYLEPSRNADFEPSRNSDRAPSRNPDWELSRNSDRAPSGNPDWELSKNSYKVPSRTPDMQPSRTLEEPSKTSDESSRTADREQSRTSDTEPSRDSDKEPVVVSNNLDNLEVKWFIDRGPKVIAENKISSERPERLIDPSSTFREKEEDSNLVDNRGSLDGPRSLNAASVSRNHSSGNQCNPQFGDKYAKDDTYVETVSGSLDNRFSLQRLDRLQENTSKDDINIRMSGQFPKQTFSRPGNHNLPSNFNSKRPRRNDWGSGPEYPSAVPKLQIPVHSWKQYKRVLSSLDQMQAQGLGEDRALYTGKVHPLIRHDDHSSLVDKLSKLKIIAQVNLTLDKEKKWPSSSIGSESLSIDFDVYLPGVLYRLSNPTLPDLRLVVQSLNEPAPMLGTLAQLLQPLQDGVPLYFAAAGDDAVAFYGIHDVSLPDLNDVQIRQLKRKY